MKTDLRKLICASACILGMLFQFSPGDVRLPLLLSDGMVLQRHIPAQIWGWADPGEKITVVFNRQTVASVAGPDGRWSIRLAAADAGGPYEMQIHANNQIVLRDILVGDVWICSGQSNMVLPMDRVKDRYAEDIAESENSFIRQFAVPIRYDFNAPAEDLQGGCWESSNPQTVLRFSAVGYFFAQDLYKTYRVPIGLINAAAGGTPVQAWLSEEALRRFPAYLETAVRFKNKEYLRQIIENDKSAQDAWYAGIKSADTGTAEGQTPWYDPAFDASAWPALQIPGLWADGPLDSFNGIVWFRKEIAIPSALAAKPARLDLGCIIDSDDVYLNGVPVGSTSYRYPPRIYRIPENLLRLGKNTLAVRIVSRSGEGGFVPDKSYQLTVEGQAIDLKGPWQYQIAATADPAPRQIFPQYNPLGLFNGMIAPLRRYAIKGVIWYQGESNAENPSDYQNLFSALIADWRRQRHQGDFPFLYVQLANYMEAKDQPSESNWALLREAQLKALAIPNTAMAVAIDLGEWNDIHPLNKSEVGRRLSLAAQKTAYGDSQVVYSGPLYKSIKRKGNKIILSFTHIGGGLIAKDGPLKGFAIAGKENRFVWAEAEIKGNQVVVWNDKINKPAAVRYGWADNPAGANLYNREGLPASPFRTDRQDPIGP